MDGKLPEISVLDSKCLMAGEFGILFTQEAILTPRNGYAVGALNLGLNPEASRALGQCFWNSTRFGQCAGARKHAQCNIQGNVLRVLCRVGLQTFAPYHTTKKAPCSR